MFLYIQKKISGWGLGSPASDKWSQPLQRPRTRSNRPKSRKSALASCCAGSVVSEGPRPHPKTSSNRSKNMLQYRFHRQRQVGVVPFRRIKTTKTEHVPQGPWRRRSRSACFTHAWILQRALSLDFVTPRFSRESGGCLRPSITHETSRAAISTNINRKYHRMS